MSQPLLAPSLYRVWSSPALWFSDARAHGPAARTISAPITGRGGKNSSRALSSVSCCRTKKQNVTGMQRASMRCDVVVVLGRLFIFSASVLSLMLCSCSLIALLVPQPVDPTQVASAGPRTNGSSRPTNPRQKSQNTRVWIPPIATLNTQQARPHVGHCAPGSVLSPLETRPFGNLGERSGYHPQSQSLRVVWL